MPLVRRTLVQGFISCLGLALVVALVALGIGCASTPPSSSDVTGKSAVLGTWEYRAEGASKLTHGKFQISIEDGELRAFLHDEIRGEVDGRVKLRGTRMELTLDNLRISGRIEDNTYRATLSRPFWDVSTSSRSRRFSRARTASFVARRIVRGIGLDPLPALECPSILRETDDGCG